MVETIRLATNQRNNSEGSIRSDNIERYSDLIEGSDFEEGVHEIVDYPDIDIVENQDNTLVRNFRIARNVQEALDKISYCLSSSIHRRGFNMDRNIFSINDRSRYRTYY